MRITLLGPGGVGGLISGALLRGGLPLTVLAHGARYRSLVERGLTLHSDLYGHFTVPVPDLREDARGLPEQDAVLICVKNGALEEAAHLIRPLVGEDTLVVPVMNGVSAGDKLRALLPGAHVLDCVIYTVSSAGADFSITQKGRFTSLQIGARPDDPFAAQAGETLSRFLRGYGLDCQYAPDVARAIWSKFVLNCAYNVVTARWGVTIGDIRASETFTHDYRVLMEEAVKVGRGCGVALPDGLVAENMAKLLTYTADSTSSLSRDFDARNPGEKDIFSREVVRLASLHHLDVPLTLDYARGLDERAASFKKEK